jgi:hypothetical protein
VTFKYQLALLTMMLSVFMTASAQVSPSCLSPATLPQLQTPPDGGVNLPACSDNVTSNLRFILNDEVVGEELLLAPPTYLVGQVLEVKLQEDLRVCNRHTEVDLWVALEVPNGTRLFLVYGEFGFPQLTPSPVPFKTGLQGGENAHSILSYEISEGNGGEYYFYAGYTKKGKGIDEFLFSLRSNRPAIKVILSNSGY